MNSLAVPFTLLLAPIGPPLVLTLGSIVVWSIGRYASSLVRLRAIGGATGILSAVALLFWSIAVALTVGLRLQPAAPFFSMPWQPFFSTGTDLLWVSNGWNWYVSCLILLLGGGGLLFGGYGGQIAGRSSGVSGGLTLALSMNVLASALLFTSSGNLLTVTLMWVVMDFFIIARNAMVPAGQGTQPHISSPMRQFQGLSMMGALLLLVGLLPAGQSGPAALLAGDKLPQETVILLLLAGGIRAGVYPLHLWLLPHRGKHLHMPDRFIDQMTPALCGLWLLGWSSGLAGEELLAQPEFVALALLGLLGSAIATFTTSTRQEHTTFVLITAVGIAGPDEHSIGDPGSGSGFVADYDLCPGWGAVADWRAHLANVELADSDQRWRSGASWRSVYTRIPHPVGGRPTADRHRLRQQCLPMQRFWRGDAVPLHRLRDDTDGICVIPVAQLGSGAKRAGPT